MVFSHILTQQERERPRDPSCTMDLPTMSAHRRYYSSANDASETAVVDIGTALWAREGGKECFQIQYSTVYSCLPDLRCSVDLRSFSLYSAESADIEGCTSPSADLADISADDNSSC